MKRTTRVTRLYKGASASMRQRMRIMQGHYLDNQAAFEDQNPDLTVGFGTDWLMAVTAADEAVPPAVGQGALTDETSAVNALMEAAKLQLQSLFYYVRQAFPTKSGMLKQYGQPQYEKARTQHDLMEGLLNLAFGTATRDAAALAAKGFTAAKLAALGTLKADLTAALTSQGQMKGDNIDATDDYITLQNAAYTPGQTVSETAKIVFMDDYAKLQMFRLTDAAGPALESHSIDLGANETKWVLFETVLAAPVQLYLHLVNIDSSMTVFVGRTTAPDEAAPTQITLFQFSNDKDWDVTALGDTGQYLRLENTQATPVTVVMTVV